MHGNEVTKDRTAIRSMFGRIAHRYDLLNRVLSLGQDVRWRRKLALRVTEANAEIVLDVCTGTGDVALSLPEEPTTLGSDFCVPMLALARRKARQRRRPLPLFAGDALELPLRRDAVDVVTVAFGVRNFEDLESGLAELVRVLRPGGHLLVLEFSRPLGPAAPLLTWWSRTVPPRIGRMISGDPTAYSYLPASVSTFPSGEEMCHRLQAAGLCDIVSEPLTGGVATLYSGRKRTPQEKGDNA